MSVILGIETSCDETSAAVLRDGILLSNVTKTQLVHHRYGGVVPEMASRAHQKLIVPIVRQALETAGVRIDEIHAVAAVYGPGLIGSLIVGLNFAKAFSLARGIPFIAVNHLVAHLYSNFLEEDKPEFPYVALIVSGGHTILSFVEAPFVHRVLGETRDDAAGEAFDKVAKMLGLGYPGGPAIDRAAMEGDPAYVSFPRADIGGAYEFSFSGIKTSVLYHLRKNGLLPGNGKRVEPPVLNHIAASFQAAVVDVLTKKTVRAAGEHRVRHVTVSGGVAANNALRKSLRGELSARGIALHIPRMDFCTDNGAMTAYIGMLRLERGDHSPLDVGPAPSIDLVDEVICHA
ncbi:MAG: tRNA (adenosine(37)-N6)-threonylcarbamoyltransferase complex transferase subunit TsaD [Ignavibacteriales bacterium CG07_land_8_20_14_0_80_59_12]|nr:MAG: tRNA (adenosine(37)-N6)-threonylcarbamoyltransferase complex transferase subunit TsaD [Ignavibacteriales bacterium CG07_land_8_20_14_0_80_59_12]